MDGNSMLSSLLPARPRNYISLSLVAMSVILWEILLTRIYSVLLYYHFAFMAVSVAMLGLTLGAILVLMPGTRLVPVSPDDELGFLAVGTGALMVLSIIVQLTIPPPFQGPFAQSACLLRTYILSALPFIPAGSFICLVLTTRQNVSRLYAADLLGAGAACAMIPWLLTRFGGPGAILIAAALASLAASFQFEGVKTPRIGALLFTGSLVLFAQANARANLLRVRWRHNGLVPPPLYEKWNAFSRIMISPEADTPFGWGIEDALRPQFQPVQQHFLEIDSGAGTPLTHFDGRFEPIRYLRYDVTAFAHYLRPNGDVLVIGPGGGRDVLTAMSFHHLSVTGVEVNGAILNAVNQVFGDFTGHLDQQPGVRFIADEGRSYLQRTPDHFDIIQASLVDTVAATAAGAYAFVENGLYTTEAWQLFLSKLTPRGVLSFSRWYYGSTTWPVEVARLVALGAESLRAMGIASPADHLLLIRNRNLSPSREGIATLLVSRSPFSEEDYAAARNTCRVLLCEVALIKGTGDPLLSAIVNSPDPAALYASLPLDISPPTDDKPFFFFHTRFKEILRGQVLRVFGGSSFNLPAVRILLQLLIATSLMSLILIVWPRWALRAQTGGESSSSYFSWAMACYFGLIGTAFMFIEIALMQRFSLFLGHPTYGFTVILFGLLLMTGLGSWTEPLIRKWGGSVHTAMLWILPPWLILMNTISPSILHQMVGEGLGMRIVVTLALIGPPAFFMGFYFPAGMTFIQQHNDPLAAWYWSVNGALSVVGSVLAMASSLAFGVRATVQAGTALYAAAVVLLTLLQASNPQVWRRSPS